MKRLTIILILFVSVVKAQPGKEAWHWYFGIRCEIDFSSGAAIAVPGPSLVSVSEGCASISDETTGQFLFGNFGNLVMNRNAAPMANGYGLYGVPNSTQGSLIIPNYGQKGIYYVFTNDYLYGTHGTHYSVVDMNQSGGLGKVILKNQPLTPSPTTEKMVAVRKCNGSDFWVITMPGNGNKFNAYSVSPSGVNTAPVVSNAGTVLTYYPPTASQWPGCGYLKASPNGKKLALGSNSDSIPILEILDFDNATGTVSNPLIINFPGYYGPYGLTFSPDNNKIYAAAHKDSTSWLYQFDLSSGNPATIIASKTLIAQTKGTSANSYAGDLSAMQMAPDGKIYIARYQNDTLSVINNPNALGLACNFQRVGLILPNTGFCAQGLPNFVDANYAGIQLNVPDMQFCNTFTTSTLDAGGGFSSYQWNTGATTQTISISSPGQYWVTVTNDQGCQRTDTVNAYVVMPFKKDTMVCDTFKANVTQTGAQTYSWYDGTNNPVKNFSQSGNYFVDVTYQSGCTLRDSLNVAVVSSPKVDLGPSSVVCKVNLQLNVNYPAVTYTWSTGVSTPSLTINQPGKYWITIQDTNGCKGSDTVDVEPGLLTYNFVMPNIVTPNEDKINDEIDFGKYQFSFFQIEIYNRWGQKLYESSDVNAIWKPAQEDGTYFYTAKYRIDCWGDAQTKNIKGFITVIR